MTICNIEEEEEGSRGIGRGREHRTSTVDKRIDEGLQGVHDVVLAPPTLKEKFKVSRNGAGMDVANTPTKAGSLSRREELSNARRAVIEQYRAMMKA